tara:strand:- start:696 stop:3143 length:2448 start_codon:yes stop_codon:yes gene_type:complete
MKTQTFQVLQLRGMNERWVPEPNEAELIRDMTWDGKDGWKDSGGYRAIATKFTTEGTGKEGALASSGNPFSLFGNRYSITSIHWFAQHNGARQWMVYETEDGRLRAFDGARAPYDDPWRDLKQINYTGDSSFSTTNNINKRQFDPLGFGTQYQVWGGRLYMVNGLNEPLVFDGEKVEKVGFNTAPAQGQGSTNYEFAATSCGWPEQHEAHNYDADLKDWLVTGSKMREDLDGGGKHPTTGDKSGAVFFNEIPGLGLGYKHIPEDPTNYIPNHLIDPQFLRKDLYQYRVTFVNERGQESPPSIPTDGIQIRNGIGEQSTDDPTASSFEREKSGCQKGGRNLIWLQIPTGGPEVVARRVYRTRQQMDSDGNLVSLSRGTKYYFVREIQDNATTGFLDGAPDTQLGSLLDESDFGPFPSDAAYIAVFKNTMFAAGSNDNLLRFSAPLMPEVFPLDNTFNIGDSVGGPITGMKATKNALVVFKRRGIYLVKGDPFNGFFTETLTQDAGCVAPNSIAEIPSLGTVFLSEQGVMMLEGALENTGTQTNLVHLSTPIPDQIAKINTSAVMKSASAIYHKNKEYWLAVPTTGSHKNDLVLIFHYEVGSWSVRENFPINCLVCSEDHRGYLFFGSDQSAPDAAGAYWGNMNGYVATSLAPYGIMVYTRGVETKNGTALATRYETTPIAFGSVFSTVQPAHVMVYAIGMGNNDMTLNYRINRTLDELRATRQAADQQDPNDRFDVWGTAVWGSSAVTTAAKWSKHRPTVIRFDVAADSQGPVKEFQFSIQCAGRRMHVIGYDIEAKVGEQRKIKSLNEALAPERR